MANKRRKIWTSLIPAMIHKRPWIFPKDEDLTLHAVLEFGKEHGKKVSLFLSAHQWKTRVPSEEEMEAIMQLEDAGALSLPGIIRICRKHADQYLGLKVVNGFEFEAKGIVLVPNVQEHVVDEGLSKSYMAEGVVRKWTNVSLYVQTSRCQG
jgi:hypothetical protein